MKNFRVWFTEEGFNKVAYFETYEALCVFVKMMINCGKFLSAYANGKDITNEFVNVIKIN